MKLCVFSDIHGNIDAFSSVLDAVCHEDVSGYIFLGDLCGYYHEVYAAFNALQRLDNLVAVLGNHDRMFLDILDGDQELRVRYRMRYGLAMEHLLEHGGREVAAWLRTLPISSTLADGTILAVHGSPTDPLKDYVYPDSQLPEVSEPNLKWVLMGHTHYKMQREGCGLVFLNPGSVGQPRDGGWPSYATLDTDTGQWDVHEVRYNREATVQAIRRAGDDTPYLIRVLQRMGGG